jgi:hypothetical protein
VATGPAWRRRRGSSGSVFSVEVLTLPGTFATWCCS